MADIGIFDGDAFTEDELTATVSNMPYVPGRIGKLGLFEFEGVRTTSVAVEENNGTLSLISNTERDAPDNVFNGGKRKVLTFETTHLPLHRIIRPSEIQNIRAYGSTTELQDAQSIVRAKMAEMVPYHDATLEYQMLGALKGIIVDADGTTVIHNLFDRFGISQPMVDFALDDDTTDVRVKCLGAARLVETGLGGATYTDLRAFCGSDFFDALVSHPNVKTAYERWQNGEFLRSDPRYTGFLFGGILWEEYRGKVNGQPFMPAGECQIFPEGVPGMYIGRFAPANMIQFANTPGLNRYASIEILNHGRGVDVLTESDPIALATRPAALVKGTM